MHLLGLWILCLCCPLISHLAITYHLLASILILLHLLLLLKIIEIVLRVLVLNGKVRLRLHQVWLHLSCHTRQGIWLLRLLRVNDTNRMRLSATLARHLRLLSYLGHLLLLLVALILGSIDSTRLRHQESHGLVHILHLLK